MKTYQHTHLLKVFFNQKHKKWNCVLVNVKAIFSLSYIFYPIFMPHFSIFLHHHSHGYFLFTRNYPKKKEREKKKPAHKPSPFCANVGQKSRPELARCLRPYPLAARLLPLLSVFWVVLSSLVTSIWPHELATAHDLRQNSLLKWLK